MDMGLDSLAAVEFRNRVQVTGTDLDRAQAVGTGLSPIRPKNNPKQMVQVSESAIEHRPCDECYPCGPPVLGGSWHTPTDPDFSSNDGCEGLASQ